jgi:hypothetical protein
MIVTFILTLYYQRKYLNIFIFNSLSYVYKLLFLSITLFIISFLLKQIDSRIILVLIPLVIITSSIIIFRYFKYFSLIEIEKYFSGYERIEYIVKKILIKNSKIILGNEN